MRLMGLPAPSFCACVSGQPGFPPEWLSPTARLPMSEVIGSAE